MTPELFEDLCSKTDFPPIFYLTAKMEEDFLCTTVQNIFYYINIITQEYGSCDSLYKDYVFNGYEFNNKGYPLSLDDGRPIYKSRKFTNTDAELLEIITGFKMAI